jgi:branched-chain amino acid transport system substrate-binding protein
VPDEKSSDDAAGEAASIRTFLIADLRGYTRYSDEHGDEAASALARRFAAIASDAMKARGGEVIELRGDEALCVFASARAAVRGAVELQRRARERVEGEPALPLGVGIGLDAGEAVPTGSGYRGRALNVAARLCSLARGGQILASEAVAHLAGRNDEAEYAPRRPTTVKGITEPVRFVEVVPNVELPPPPPPPSSPKPRWTRRRSVLLIGTGLLLSAGVAVAAIQLSAGGGNPSRLRTLASNRCSPLRYEAPGSPQLLIIADLPLQPGVLETTTPMVDAMTLALERRGYKAGRYRVGLQLCDDAAPGSVGFDEGTCSANAHDYVENPSVIAIAGPYSSGCAVVEIPILNGAPGGPLAIVSPSTTYVGLTRHTLALGSEEPDVYYPTGRRNYARVLPADDVQAAADAIVAQRLGVKRVYAIDQGDVPSKLFVDYFIRGARRLGIAVAGRGSWDAGASRYGPLAAAIARTGADGVFLAVPSGPRSVRLLTELRARLGGAVQFMAPDVFDPETGVLAGAAAEGMTFSQPGPANDHLGREGKQFVASFSQKFGAEPTRFAVTAAQAIDVLLDAIAPSDGTRASVTTNLFKTSVSNGILGSFSITPTGDTTLNAVAIYRIIGGRVTTFATVVVPDALVAPD